MHIKRHNLQRFNHSAPATRHRRWKAGQANLRDWQERALQIDERVRHSLRNAPAANDWTFDSERQQVRGAEQGGSIDE